MADLSLSKLSWKAQLAVFMLLAVAAAGVFYWYYELPQQQAIEAKQTELRGINLRIQKGQTTARQLAEFRREVAELQARLDSLRPILPEEKDAAELLRRINTIALSSNLVVRGFRPQATTMRALHAEWPISLELEGTYHNLGTFLDRVSKFPRIINVTGLNIKGRDRPAPNATIDVTCTATTFVLLDASGARPGTAPKLPTKTE